MKHHNIHTNEDDELLRDLFSSIELEEPSADFTKKVMHTVGSQAPVFELKKETKLNYTTIYFALSCASILLLLWFAQSNIELLDIYGMSTLHSTFKYSIDIIMSTFHKIPSLAFIITLACGLLYIIDKTIFRFALSKYEL
ncbi:hypothetical protein [Saccharicrinis aurantiacus]|uniref:hypothetical protein n=1 Tax=Saccharicrinis aurantiacus TaxID=1849719 RepID=UPI000839AC0B|nr:hypothetical protein [Saccharicrinis aurantiacus]